MGWLELIGTASVSILHQSDFPWLCCLSALFSQFLTPPPLKSADALYGRPLSCVQCMSGLVTNKHLFWTCLHLSFMVSKSERKKIILPKNLNIEIERDEMSIFFFNFHEPQCKKSMQ